MLGGPDHRARRDLGLKDRRDGSGPAAKRRTHPRELGVVEAGKLDHRQTDVAALVHELTAQAVGEGSDRELRRAVRRLQGDRPMGQRRADLHDRPAIALAHAAQRGQRAVNGAEIVDLHDPPVVLRRDLPREGQDGGHRVVDPGRRSRRARLRSAAPPTPRPRRRSRRRRWPGADHRPAEPRRPSPTACRPSREQSDPFAAAAEGECARTPDARGGAGGSRSRDSSGAFLGRAVAELGDIGDRVRRPEGGQHPCQARGVQNPTTNAPATHCAMQ